MILVDTSVWIEFLNGRLRASADDVLQFVTCAPIAQEILQGLREDRKADEFREAFLALPVLSDPLALATFLEADEIYRLGRRKGYTIRSSTDCLIAAIAIENRIPVWYKNRDFAMIAEYTSLRVLQT